MAALLVFLDGAADEPSLVLNGKTPLELAPTPNLDHFSLKGSCSVVEVLPGGAIPQTHSGVLSFLGQSPLAIGASRGPLEALGEFGDLPEGSLCARANFSSLVNDRIPDRRVNRDLGQEEANALVECLQAQVSFPRGERLLLTSLSTYRLSLVIRPGFESLSSSISNTDPGYATNADYVIPTRGVSFAPILSQPSDPTSHAAQYTADLINLFSAQANELLEQHPINKARRLRGVLPANHIITRDFGIGVPKLKSFAQQFGLKSAYVYEMPVEKGIARLLCMRHFPTSDMAGDIGGYAKLAKKVMRLLGSHDFLVCHIKGPDEFGHDGDWRGKRDVLGRIDEGFMGVLRDQFDLDGSLLIVTSDHATPWSLGAHSSAHVPLLATGLGASSDNVASFNEDACRRGSNRVVKAHQLMTFVTDRLSSL